MIRLVASLVLVAGAILAPARASAAPPSTVQHEPFAGTAGKPLVILIEENHAALNVQRGVWTLLEALKAQAKAHVVCVEGLPPAPAGQRENIGALPLGRDARRATVTGFFDKGWLSGVEAAALLDDAIQIHGVEDETLYAAHRSELAREQTATAKALLEPTVAVARLKYISNKAIEELRLPMNRLAKFIEDSRENLDGPDPKEQDVLNSEAEVRARFLKGNEDLVPLKEAVWAATLSRESLPCGAVATGTRIASLAPGSRDGAKGFIASLPAGLEWSRVPTAAGYHALSAKPTAELVAYAQKRSLLTAAEADQLNRRMGGEAGRGDGATKLQSQRDEAMLRNTAAVADKAGVKTVVLVIGAMHTPNLTRLLRDGGYPHVTFTPPGVSRAMPALEIEWFNRNGVAKAVPLDNLFKSKPKLATAREPVRASYRMAEAFVYMAGELTAGRKCDPIPVGDLFVVGDSGEEHVIEVKTRSDRRVTLRLPQGGFDTLTHGRELVKHWLEFNDALPAMRIAGNANSLPVVAVFGGGAFVSRRTPGGVETRLVGLGFSPIDAEAQFVKDFSSDPARTARLITGFVNNGTQRNLEPNAPGFGYLPFLDDVLRALPPGQEPVKVMVRMPDVGAQGINLQLVYEILRAAGVARYQRDVQMYQVADVTRRPEPLKAAFERFAARPTSGAVKHVFASSFPAGEKAFKASLYGQDYTGQQRKSYGDWKPVEAELTLTKDVVRAANKANGFDLPGGGVIEAKSLGQLIDELSKMFKPGDESNIAFTLATHYDKGKEYFYLADARVPVDEFLLRLNQAKVEGRLPPQFTPTLIVCDFAATRFAEQFLSTLSCPYIVAPRVPVRIDVGVKLYRWQVEAMNPETPADEASLKALRRFVREELPKEGPQFKGQLLEFLRLWVALPHNDGLACS